MITLGLNAAVESCPTDIVPRLIALASQPGLKEELRALSVKALVRGNAEPEVLGLFLRITAGATRGCGTTDLNVLKPLRKYASFSVRSTRCSAKPRHPGRAPSVRSNPKKTAWLPAIAWTVVPTDCTRHLIGPPSAMFPCIQSGSRGRFGVNGLRASPGHAPGPFGEIDDV